MPLPPASASPVSASPASGDLSTLDQIRRVLRIEAEALQQMIGDIGAAHEQAVDLLVAATGRIIVSGVGKSGHIGRKIAATFASTGAPAQFVHPTEASHGDLGMITRSDACLVISNSGETSELADLVTYCGRFGIALIAITARGGQYAGETGGCDPIAAQCARGLFHWHCAHHLDHRDAGAWGCAGRGADASARVSARGFSDLPSGGQAGRATDHGRGADAPR